jgi:hypothetical protein
MPKTRNEIIDKAREICASINNDKELLQKMSARTWRRIQLAIDVDGEQVEVYDK